MADMQDISRRLVRREEALGICICGAIVLILFHQFDAFDRLAAFLSAHEAWQLDEIFFTICTGGVAALFIAIRRAHDMRREIAAREAAELRITQAARHDPLTGLPNRRVLEEELRTTLLESGRAGQECAVLFIDLDHFKPVNEAYGHEFGDALLIEVSNRFRKLANPGVLTYRLGGDEFVCVISYEPGSQVPNRLAAQIILSLAEPFQIGERKIEIGATVGISRCPADGKHADELIHCADVAMCEAERTAPRTYRFFHAEMDVRLSERAALELEIRAALGAGDIIPYFQPVIDLDSGRVAGFEALARWIHPVRGIISPDHFIPILEDLGLVDALGQHILSEGCLVAQQWPPHTTLSINISPQQLSDPWLSPKLLSALAKTGFAPSRLIVEITEDTIIGDIDLAAEVFASLQNAGIRIALDDFGKGYSSLAHLRQLRFNHLKIDSSFVRSMESLESQKIVSAVVGLGKSLGMSVTAEGVETVAIADALRGLGCEQAQGFLFGRPVPASETAAAAAMRFKTQTHLLRRTG
ncbi:MAG: EAL domain-containing protein [Candidatus Andeanibacterium colombiense]|uniref:EAL domain-containing protein n=1 Tax=Candidatus Andeanibacterium colombiense TaxID=3121345 RepID=A0AAJ5X6Z6_9SPHN|nr:MAG: EAL domain-containing protein [Sphingomonadaceae bacterium]